MYQFFDFKSVIEFFFFQECDEGGSTDTDLYRRIADIADMLDNNNPFDIEKGKEFVWERIIG